MKMIPKSAITSRKMGAGILSCLLSLLFLAGCHKKEAAPVMEVPAVAAEA